MEVISSVHMLENITGSEPHLTTAYNWSNSSTEVSQPTELILSVSRCTFRDEIGLNTFT